MDYRRQRTDQREIIVMEEQLDKESPSLANNWTVDHRRRRTVQRGIIVEEEQLDEGSSSQTESCSIEGAVTENAAGLSAECRWISGMQQQGEQVSEADVLN